MLIVTMAKINLAGMSADQLEALSHRALGLARDLRAKEPTVALALEHGVKNESYSTVRWGWVKSYAGEANITMADGSRWRAIGHKPDGCPEMIYREGYVEFVPLVAEECAQVGAQ